MPSATTNNSSSSFPSFPSSSSSSSSSMSPRNMGENHGMPAAAAAQSRPPSRQVSSPWNQIVRGESETIAAVPSSFQSNASIEPIASVSVAPSASLLTAEAATGDEKSEEFGDQSNAGKKPVWKRPSNGTSEVGPVMGASSWPTLSETTKASSNKSSSDSIKSIGDGSSSIPVSQGFANASVPAPKQVSRANPNPTPNNSRQRSFRQYDASGSANGTASQPSAQSSFAELPLHNPSPRGQNQNNGFASQNHGGTDNLSLRDSYRNQNGNHHQSHGGRRNQEHRNQNWAFQRSFNGRDGNAHSQRGTPAFVRYAPPHVQPIPQFMAARPFGSPLPFHPEYALPYYPQMSFIPPRAPAPVFYHFQDPPLNVKLQKQIHYYFSEENLITDIYLRGLMDDQGFVPLRMIAGFKKVAALTDSMQQIVEALQGSPFVEVQGDRIRKRQNWQRWLLPKMRNPAASIPQSDKMADAIANRVGNLALNQRSVYQMGGSSSQLQPEEAENKAVSDGQEKSSGVDPVRNHNDSDGANIMFGGVGK